MIHRDPFEGHAGKVTASRPLEAARRFDGGLGRGQNIPTSATEQGESTSGTQVLRIVFPVAAGSPMSEWDGSLSDAMEWIDCATETAAEGVIRDRVFVGRPTGWELEFDCA